VRMKARMEQKRATYGQRAIVESQTHDALGSIIYCIVGLTAVRPGADIGTGRVDASGVDRHCARTHWRGLRDVRNLSGLNSGVERVLPSLRHRVRIRRPGRIRGGPRRTAHVREATGWSRSLASEESMREVIIVLIPAIGQRTLGNVTVTVSVVVVRGDCCGVNGGGGEEDADEGEEEGGTSEGGEGQHGGHKLSW
jgi:hypothetical protein